MNKYKNKVVLLVIGVQMLTLNMIGQELISDSYIQNGAKVISNEGSYEGDLQFISNTPTDADSNPYSTVQVGNNIWLTENFRSTHFNDGSEITVNYHPNDPSQVYGASYSWNAIVNPNFAPIGWHVATDTEWQQLHDFVAGEGVKLKDTGSDYWNTANGTNETGFNAYGSAHIYGSALKSEGTWWAATENDGANGLRWSIFDDGSMWRGANDKSMFFPVRLVKNKPNEWKLVQWGSNSSVMDITPVVETDGWYTWQDANKEVHMGLQGVRDYDLFFGVDGVNEFGDVFRKNGEPWPHLLLEQGISAPGFQGPGCPPLDEVNELQFHIEARLGNDFRDTRSGYDVNLHTAQFQVFFTIQNLNINSPGYGQYIWFGIPIYDDRYESPELLIKVDPGTETLIYTLAYEDVATVSAHTKQWVSLDVDIYPHVLIALQEAWSLGYLVDSQNIADYKIGSMNIGWEVTGLNQVDMKIRDLSLFAQNNSAIGQEWHFDNDLENWAAGGDLSNVQWANGGYLNADVTGNDPTLTAPSGDLNFDITNQQFIHVKMKNSSNGSMGKIYFATVDSPGWSEDKTIEYQITSNDAAYTTYEIDMSVNALWTGTLSQLRIDPIDEGGNSGAGGSISIDYISITSASLGIDDYTQTDEYFKLEQNYPNPANDATTIKYIISKSGKVKLTIYDSKGRNIEVLVDDYNNNGTYTIPFNVRKYTPGLYFCKLTTGNLEQTIKILVNH